MNDAKTKQRRARFKAYFETELRGDRKEFCRITGYSKSWLSMLLDPNRPFNETASGNVATRLGLPADYFEGDAAAASAELRDDTPDGRRLRSEISKIAEWWSPLFQHQKEALFEEMRKAHAQALKLLEEMARRGYKMKTPRKPGDDNNQAQ